MTMLMEREVAAPATSAAVRRRRVILGLTAATAAAALAALDTGSPAGWAALVVVAGVFAAYGVLLRRSRRLAAEREFELAMEPNARFLEDLADLTVFPESGFGPDPSETVVALDAVPAWQQGLALARFIASYVAGWAIAPLVFALTLLVGRTPRDTTGQRWLANLQAAQTRLKEQSVRTLVVSATATASVAGVGTIAVMGGAGVAGATPLATAAAVGTPAVAGSGFSASASNTVYRVQPGDTLSSIAGRFGTTYEALAASNHIVDPNLIYPGQVLAIPGASAAAYRGGDSSSAGGTAVGGTYTVRAGDTLSSISARYGTTFESLASINGISNPNLIEVGEVSRLTGSAAAAATGTALASAPLTAVTPAAAVAHAPAPAPTPAPTPPAPAPAATGAQIAVRTAEAQIGKPYVWAGAGPSSFDCSGLVMYAWAAAGVQLAHYTVTQYEETARISQSELQPGDLVFYNTGDGANPGHVTMYIGNGQVITADSPGTYIKVVPLDWDGTPMGFGRVR